MNARIAEIKSKLDTALSNGHTVELAYNHAVDTGLRDEVFHAMTARCFDLLEISTMKVTEWRDKSGCDLRLCIRLAEEEADEALKVSEMALKQMQVAFTAAPYRKRMREIEGKTKENEAKEQVRKRAKEGEASNKPGGSNA